MPRSLRLRLAGAAFHVIQRGNNRSACFFSWSDRWRYLDELKEQAQACRVAVHAYVLMTNHVHLLMTPEDGGGISRLMKLLGQRYVQYINTKYKRTGTLWGGRFRSSLVDTEGYLIVCQRYIEANPIRAGLVERASEYPWSSYRANALGWPDPLVTPHPVFIGMGRAAYLELSREPLDSRLVAEIRQPADRRHSSRVALQEVSELSRQSGGG